MGDDAAIGFRCHSGWAMYVVASGTDSAPVVFDRGRIELVSDGLPRQPYHAVAEAGAPAGVIGDVEIAAQRAVARTLRAATVVAVGVVATERRIPSELDDILRSHALLHAAEGRMFELAVIEAADHAELPAHAVEPKSLEVSPAVDRLGRSIGSPWQKDHKWAATAALHALAATAREPRRGRRSPSGRPTSR